MPRPTASETSRMIRERKLSALELVGEHLDRIEQLNPRFHAFIELRREAALEEAEAADAAIERGGPVGPLHGVPISIKSSIAVRGLRFECGSPTRTGMVADQDAVSVQRLKRAGAIILGNTNVPEMLMAYETSNPLYGRTSHAMDVARTPGGSSGGEAAAIALGFSLAGMGSDGGGSIRVPAHFSGICGLKPTPGRIPITGHWPESGGPFALLGVVGPMAGCVEDLDLMFRSIAGFDPGDPMATPLAPLQISEHEIKNLAVGFFCEHPDAPATPETRAAVEKAASALRDSGFRVEPWLPDMLQQAREYWWTLFVRLASEMLRPQFAGREDELSTILSYSDRPPTKEDLLAAWFGRDELRLRLAQQMSRFPVVICPVCSVPAFRHGEREWNVHGRRVTYMDAMAYTQWFNLLGNPAVVMPVGQSPDGLPIGVQIVGQPHREELILAVARALEQALGRTRVDDQDGEQRRRL